MLGRAAATVGLVVTTTGIPQCVSSFYHRHGHFVVVSAYRFSHGRSSLIKNMERKRSLS
jgi:hypothetical protein